MSGHAHEGGADRTIDADAVVIGAGIAGSSVAYALAKRGWNVVLLDKHKCPRHKACGEFLSPESRSSLRSLGLESVVRAHHPAVITSARIHTERGASLEIPLPGPAWGISRFNLDAKLQAAAQAAGVRLIAPCPVLGVERSEEGYRVDCGGGGSRSPELTIRSRIAIGAGGRSASQGLRGFKPASDERTYVGIKSHFTRTDSSPVVDLIFFRGGYIGIAPIEGERFNVAALVTPAVFSKQQPASAVERILEQAVRRHPVLAKRLAGAVPVPGTQASAYPVAIRTSPLAWNGMPLVGDAAAVIPPFCGDGMAMALRSAELCAPLADACLRGQITLEQWKDAYTKQLQEQFAGALRWGERLERILSRPVLSTLLVRLGSFLPGTAERLVRSTRLRD